MNKVKYLLLAVIPFVETGAVFADHLSGKKSSASNAHYFNAANHSNGSGANEHDGHLRKHTHHVTEVLENKNTQVTTVRTLILGVEQ